MLDQATGAERHVEVGSGHAKTYDASVVIVNWNTIDLLRACLRSVFDQTRGAAVEVIVIDNGSVDGSVEMVAADFPEAVLRANSKNLGFARGCNQGMAIARGRYFILLNSDTVLVGDPLSELVAHMDAHPEAGAGGCALLYPDGYLQGACGRFPGIAAALRHKFDWQAARLRARDKRMYFSNPFLSYAEHQRPQDVDWVAGCCMIVRREVVEAVGPLDESIFLFAEEWDWCYRIKAAGWRILYTPGPKVTHFGHASWTLSDGKRATALLAGQDYFLRKHRGPVAAWTQRALRLGGSALKLAAWGVLYLVRPRQRAFYGERLNWQWHTFLWCMGVLGRTRVTAEDIRPREQGREGILP
jgi:GT2 family glycosyltransferase